MISLHALIRTIAHKPKWFVEVESAREKSGVRERKKERWERLNTYIN